MHCRLNDQRMLATAHCARKGERQGRRRRRVCNTQNVSYFRFVRRRHRLTARHVCLLEASADQARGVGSGNSPNLRLLGPAPCSRPTGPRGERQGNHAKS